MLLPGGLRGAAFRAWAWARARGRAGVAGVSSVPSGSPGTPSASLSTPSASLGTPSGSLTTPSGSPGTPSASLSTPSASPETPSGPPSAPAVPEPRGGPGAVPVAVPVPAAVLPPEAPPVLRSCRLPLPPHRAPVQAWVGSLQQPDAERRGLADLHPEVFAVRPRLDILHTVAMWQKNFKRISYAKVKSRAEVRGGGRKPWRQKGSGRARQGSIRSPLWRGGGIAHGPRGPTSYFYMLPMKVRVLGLKVALTVKLMQDDLFVVQSLELPSPDPQYLQGLARARGWGHSVLIVDVDEPPQNLQAAVANLKTFTLIPALGLNVYSILKHQSLVLTLGTLSLLEEKLLWHDARFCALYPFALPYRDLP